MLNQQFSRKIQFTRVLLSEQAARPEQTRRQYRSNVTVAGMEGSENFEGLVGYNPEAQPAFDIANGWGEKRLSFVLTGEVTQLIGSKIEFVVSGYTSYVGALADGKIDPQMEFFVNSAKAVRKTIETTPAGERIWMHPVSSQHVYCHPQFSGMYGEKQIYRARPEDAYAGMKLSHLMAPDVLDVRTILDTRPIGASRRHLLPNVYVDDILNGYKRAQLDQSFGCQREEDILENARGYVMETLIQHHPFFKMLVNIQDGFLSNRFTWRDLLAMDPSIDDKTAVVLGASPERANVDSPHHADLVSLAGWTTAQGVTAVMDMLQVDQVKFSATNRISEKQRLEDPTMLTDLQVQDIGSMIYDGAKPLLVYAFKNQIERFLLKHVSGGNQIDYRMYVDANVYGETMVEIAIDGSERHRFVLPTFADSLYSPLLMSEGMPQLTQDLETILQHATDQLESGLNAITSAPAPANTWGAI